MAEGVIAEIHPGAQPRAQDGDLLAAIEIVELAGVDEADRGHVIAAQRAQQIVIEAGDVSLIGDDADPGQIIESERDAAGFATLRGSRDGKQGEQQREQARQAPQRRPDCAHR